MTRLAPSLLLAFSLVGTAWAAGWLTLMFGHGLVGRYFALFAPHP